MPENAEGPIDATSYPPAREAIVSDPSEDGVPDTAMAVPSMTAYTTVEPSGDRIVSVSISEAPSHPDAPGMRKTETPSGREPSLMDGLSPRKYTASNEAHPSNTPSPRVFTVAGTTA